MFRFLLICIFIFTCTYANEINKPIKYRFDDSSALAIREQKPTSHIKVYLPSIPYSYIMRLVNGTLTRLDNSPKGWEYFLAKSHEKVNEVTYDFWLREDVKFQDGSKFDADSVINNFEIFKKGAFTYTDIHNTLDYVEKLEKYKIRIHLKKPYGMLFNDLARINFYTDEYLKKYSWSSKGLAENTKVPGPYGAGPYMLVEGFATGLAQSEKIVLKANPYYFVKNQPYIKKVTIYTKLPIEKVVENISQHEGLLDIAPIPFNKKTEITNSPYSKLVSVKSSYNFSVHMNLMNPSSVLQNKEVRQALNQALNQEKLIKYAYKNEAVISPFPLSSNYFYARDISQKYIKNPKSFFTKKKLHKILKGVELKVVTQDRFMSLWKGIEYQLNQYGVKINYDITTDETYVLHKLLTNRKNIYDWDLLIWGNADWYGHPWTSFFGLYTKNQWSAIKDDNKLDTKFQDFFKIESSHSTFTSKLENILEYLYDESYMLSLPSPNVLLALNKEVVFTPSPVAILRLWEAKLTPFHWSIRESEDLPSYRKTYIYPKRINYDE